MRIKNVECTLLLFVTVYLYSLVVKFNLFSGKMLKILNLLLLVGITLTNAAFDSVNKVIAGAVNCGHLN